MSIQTLQSEMAIAINGHIHPNMEDSWSQFKCMMSIYLSPAEISSLKNIFDAFTLLLNKEVITYGNYEKLREVFDSIGHQLVCGIIDNFTKQMQDIG